MSPLRKAYQFPEQEGCGLCDETPFKGAFLFQLVQITRDEKREAKKLGEPARTGVQD